MSELMQLLRYFNKAKKFVDANFPDDITWLKEIFAEGFTDNLTKERFMDEYAFVVCCSGFRNSTVVKFWGRFKEAANNWNSSIFHVYGNYYGIFKRLYSIFSHERKIDAIVHTWYDITNMHLDDFKFKLMLSKVDINDLKQFPFIGDTTKYHLARNIGIDCVKPDLWLQRITENYMAYSTPYELCRAIQNETKYKLGFIDSILWRYAEQTKETK